VPVQKKEKGNVVEKQLVVNDLIAYQEGAVVSRTLIDKLAGTVTIFAFEEGEGRERAHGAIRCHGPNH